jgi:hypothetical protein
MDQLAIARHPKVNYRCAIDFGNQIGSSPESDHRHLHPAGMQHSNTPHDGSITKIMNEIGQVTRFRHNGSLALLSVQLLTAIGSPAKRELANQPAGAFAAAFGLKAGS